MVLPAVTALLQPFPVTTDTAAVAHAARHHAPFAGVAAADRRLTLALLSYSDSLRIYSSGHGQRETIGQRPRRLRGARLVRRHHGASPRDGDCPQFG